MKELSLHILDIAENSVHADADKIEIAVTENLKNDTLSIRIQDNGKGMDQALVRQITDPFITSRTTRKVGLGIPFFKAAAEACNGSFQILSEPGKGTEVKVSFQRSHIDRMPLGDLRGTYLALIIGYPDVNWILKYGRDEREFILDDNPIKEILDGVPLSEPEVIQYLREVINEGFNRVSKNESVNIKVQETR